MTKTALANLEMQNKREIAAADRKLKASEGRKDRAVKKSEIASKEKIARRQNWANIGSSLIKGAGGFATGLINDPSWYTRYFKDLKEFVNIPTYERLGGTLYKGLYHKGGARPGIMVLRYSNSIGNQDKAVIRNNPINQILMRSKEMVLKLNSRSNVNWEAGDLGFNLLATASIVTLLGECKRALEIYRTYRGDSQYLAAEVLYSMGLNYADIESNYASYRKLYVTLARRFNSSIVAPKQLSLYDRKWYLATNIFVDHDIKQGVRQLYAAVTDDYFSLNNTGTALTCSPVHYTPMSPMLLGGLFAAAEASIQSIVENPDFVEMYADLRAAFGQDLFTLPEDIAETIFFNDDPLNRIQIHNIRTLPMVYASSGGPETPKYLTGDGDVNQDSAGYLYQGSSTSKLYTFTYSSNASSLFVASGGTWKAFGTSFVSFFNGIKSKGLIFDSINDVIDGDEILDITRGSVCDIIIDKDANNMVTATLTQCGTEIFTCCVIGVLNSSSALDRTMIGTTMWFASNAPYYFNPFLDSICYLADFDWAPFAELLLFDAGTSTLFSTKPYQLDHAFNIDSETLGKIHEAAVLSEFYLADTVFNGSGR